MKNKRAINGVLLLDKPTAITSNRALQIAKRLFNAKKAGHTGSLDPLATGLLPICFGEATKFSQFLLDADKSYEVTAQLGVTTTTGDSEGEVLTQDPIPTITPSQLEDILETFRGEGEQVPPMYSALKFQGRPLYELARKGIEIDRPPRKITIFDLTLCELGEDFMKLKVHCSKGTYIRSLVIDIGAALGCGAHVTALRRTQIAGCPVEHMVSLEHLEATEAPPEQLEQHLLATDIMLQSYPAIELSQEQTIAICQGKIVDFKGLPNAPYLRLYSPLQGFLGLASAINKNQLAAKRLCDTSKTVQSL